MSFFKKAAERLKDAQSEAVDKFNQLKTSHSSNNDICSPNGPPPIPPRPTHRRDPNTTGAKNNQGKFIIRNPNTGNLEVEGTGEVVKFASLCAPELFDNEGFEKEDTMRTISQFGIWPVTRTYTLKVKSCRINRGHINGWDCERNDFMYDEDMFKSIDYTIAMAAKYNVRLIIPIVNQDFGSEETNWVGNFSDLIRHRHGLQDWNEAKQMNWWEHPDCIDSMKKIVTFLLNRVNHVTGVRIGDDPTILAFETGNEMNCGGLRPAPAAWTLEIAAHIKSLAPRTLIMDGSFARTDAIQYSYEKEVLESDLVDIISWHYYGYGEKRRVQHDVAAARNHRKAFICGEYGFFAHGHEFESFLKHCSDHGVTGTLAWSLRPHSIKGGFKTHGEGNGIWSYHAPGWKPYQIGQDDPEWDHREKDVIGAIRKAAFKLTGDKVPKIELVAPYVFPVNDGQSFSWRGTAWADHYEVWCNTCDGAEDGWKLCQSGVTDNVKEGRLKYPSQSIYDQIGINGAQISLRMRGMTSEKLPGPFSNVINI